VTRDVVHDSSIQSQGTTTIRWLVEPINKMRYIAGMDTLQTRLMFALSVLNRDEDARLILSDLLESDGELGMANWARARKKTWQKRLDFVIGILPHRLTLRITSDFMVHILGLLNEQPRPNTYGAHPPNEADISPLIQRIHIISRWTQGKATADELEEAIRTMSWTDRRAYGILDIQSVMQTLHLAVLQTKQIAENPPLNRQASIDSIRNACRKVIRRSREMLRPVGHSFLRSQAPETRPDSGLPNQLAQWQYQRTIGIIEMALKDCDETSLTDTD